MPSDYVGDPTATQAPSPPPTPGSTPTMHMPADGDAANAASVQQDFKVTADFIAWLMSPRAQASSWDEAVVRFKDARLNDRFIVDHFGLPRGEWLAWREKFGRRTDWLITGAGTASVREWDLVTTGGASNMSANNGGVGNFMAQPYLEIEVDNTSGLLAYMKLAPDANTLTWSADMLAVLDFTMEPTDFGAAPTWIAGIVGQSEVVNTILHGAYFFAAQAVSANWQAATVNGAAPTTADTGVTCTAGVSHHFMIAVVGANIADDSGDHALFFIDGALVADITATIPTGAQMHQLFGGVLTGVGGGTKKLRVGCPGWVQGISQSTP